MNIPKYLVPLLLFNIAAAMADEELSDRQIANLEGDIVKAVEEFELGATDPPGTEADDGWVLRSKHFVFGMPELKDRRHDFTPSGQTGKRPGLSVLVREGFVAGHFDRMRSPLWVAQRWTEADYHRMKKVGPQQRPWKRDLELPPYARAGGRYGTSYNGNQTKMDRGHMARHAMNRAWGEDNSDMGCLMSNSTPQHRDVNRGEAWTELEDAVRDVVASPEYDIGAVWTITGAIFRDKDNPPGETPEQDFAAVAFIGDGFGTPAATYKITAWFDESGHFQARGYVFEQSDRMSDPEEYLTRIDEIEERTGVDFFPLLKDDIEDELEPAEHDDMWGAQ